MYLVQQDCLFSSLVVVLDEGQEETLLDLGFPMYLFYYGVFTEILHCQSLGLSDIFLLILYC